MVQYQEAGTGPSSVGVKQQQPISSHCALTLSRTAGSVTTSTAAGYMTKVLSKNVRNELVDAYALAEQVRLGSTPEVVPIDDQDLLTA